MTIALREREENHVLAFNLMLRALGDESFDTTVFEPESATFELVLRTTWEQLNRFGHLDEISQQGYRLTAKGWLVALELSGASKSNAFQGRLGKLLAAMKRHVKGRKESVIIPLEQLATESGEPATWIFNIVESGGTSTGNNRTGAKWYNHEKGRLIEIPVDFNLEPVDIAAALTEPHLERIRELEEQLEVVEEERGRYHCPYCDAEMSGIGHEDVPEYHAELTHESFGCGYHRIDGREHSPCPYGPNWPEVEEFDFEMETEGKLYICRAFPNTERASRAVYSQMTIGRTKEEALESAKKRVRRKQKHQDISPPPAPLP